jgi:membrane protein
MTTEPDPRRPGMDVETPAQMPADGWVAVLKRVYQSIGRDHLSTLSAGIAFFGLFAIFPAIAAIVMVAGIAIQPPQLQAIIESLAAALPEEAAKIIIDQVSQIVSDGDTALGVALIFSLGLTLVSASAGIRTLMDGLNAAYRETEERSFLVFFATGLALTFMMIIGFIIASAITLAVPILLETLTVPGWLDWAVSLIRWPIFALLAILGLGLIFRFGPSRRPAKWRWLSPGSLAATLLWVAFSVAFSAYVRNFGSYTETYGALAGVIILMTWLWLSAFIVLLGAELNAQLEHQTERDTTRGRSRPKGRRGAVVADTSPAS